MNAIQCFFLSKYLHKTNKEDWKFYKHYTKWWDCKICLMFGEYFHSSVLAGKKKSCVYFQSLINFVFLEQNFLLILSFCVGCVSQFCRSRHCHNLRTGFKFPAFFPYLSTNYSYSKFIHLKKRSLFLNRYNLPPN